jgi:hypothetical protein
MENDQSTESLINKITLLKQALIFYANPKNYEGENSLIIKDNGHQANFALEKLDFLDSYQEQQMKYAKALEDEIDLNNPENLQRFIQTVKNIVNES